MISYHCAAVGHWIREWHLAGGRHGGRVCVLPLYHGGQLSFYLIVITEVPVVEDPRGRERVFKCNLKYSKA